MGGDGRLGLRHTEDIGPLPCGESAHQRHGSRQRKGDRRTPAHLSIVQDVVHPLLELFPGHGHAGSQHAHARSVPPGRRQHQHMGVIQSLLGLELVDHPLVTGQLAVGAAHIRRCPDQRIEPMNGAAQKPQQGPQMVAALVVAHLMSQHLHRFLGRCAQGQGDVGPENAYQTGTGQRVGKINGNGAHVPLAAQKLVLFQQPPGNGLDPPSPKPQTEAEIGGCEPDQHQRSPGQINFHQRQGQHPIIHAFQ